MLLINSFRCGVGVVVLLFSSISNSCDLSLRNGFGPWDYYSPLSSAPTGANPSGAIKRVTNVHLTPNMLAMKSGNTSHSISPDLSYTLRAIPNHPQALDLASRIAYAKLHYGSLPKWQRENPPLTVECYLQRALKVNPSAPLTYMIYGIHNHRMGNYEDALKNYLDASALGFDSAELKYNMGLTYFELKQYQQAYDSAKVAYANGYPFPGLRNKLMANGTWEP
ncbi:MAG: hypothetical protein V7677_14725 [Motiliproteus sp.]